MNEREISREEDAADAFPETHTHTRTNTHSFAMILIESITECSRSWSSQSGQTERLRGATCVSTLS